jgi:NAD(P)-dependent dehydrogenase (short-subunit alcohol dehydrogenase family)
MENLKGKIAFVTGAAKGNGEGIARVLHAKGATVLLADVDPRVHAVVESLGDRAQGYEVDVADGDAVSAVAKAVLDEYGRLDILVNNAGIARLIRANDIQDELFHLHYRVNVAGVYHFTRSFLPTMMAQKYGRIINMSSVTGPRVADPGMMGYAMSKAAVLGFTKAIAIDTAGYNITANAILPGYIRTPMVEHTAHETNPDDPEKVIAGIAAGIPMGRLGRPEEVGYLAAFLASDEAAYITGGEFLIDGGSTLPETTTVGR